MSGGDGGDDDGDALARAEATLLRKYFYTLIPYSGSGSERVAVRWSSVR